MTLSGIICGVLIASVVGGFFGIGIWSSSLKWYKKLLYQFLIWLVFFCVAGFGLSWEERDFNNGICPQCDTKYQAIQRRNSSTYYECPNCFFGTWY